MDIKCKGSQGITTLSQNKHQLIKNITLANTSYSNFIDKNLRYLQQEIRLQYLNQDPPKGMNPLNQV